jgi:hypothetical protein
MAFSKYEDSTNMVVASVARQMQALYAEFQADQLSEKEFLYYGDKILNAEKFAHKIDDGAFLQTVRTELAKMKELSRALL